MVTDEAPPLTSGLWGWQACEQWHDQLLPVIHMLLTRDEQGAFTFLFLLVLVPWDLSKKKPPLLGHQKVFKSDSDDDCLAGFIRDQSSFLFKDQQSVFTQVEGQGISSQINGTHVYAGSSQAQLHPSYQGLLVPIPTAFNPAVTHCLTLPPSLSHQIILYYHSEILVANPYYTNLCIWLYPVEKKKCVYENVLIYF